MNTYVKDPNAVLDYQFDWTAWLDGDTIDTVTWTVPADLTKADDSKTTTTATVWLSGGSLNTTSDVTCRITTAGGRTDERTIRIIIRDR